MRLNNAYMLSYTRKRKPVAPSLPKPALAKVEEDKAKFLEQIASFSDSQKEREEQHAAFLAQFSEVWDSIGVDNPSV